MLIHFFAVSGVSIKALISSSYGSILSALSSAMRLSRIVLAIVFATLVAVLATLVAFLVLVVDGLLFFPAQEELAISLRSRVNDFLQLTTLR